MYYCCALLISCASSHYHSINSAAAARCMLQTAAYEKFMRRVIRRVPGAALLAVSAFHFMTLDSPARDATGYKSGDSVALPSPYYGSGMAAERATIVWF
jgi:hypothetical protein